MAQVVDRFVEALRKVERDRNIEPMAALFAEDCELGTVVLKHRMHGSEAARHFWEEYRQSFGQVESEFRSVVVSGDRAALEWTTRGTNRDGAPFEYGGVSMLEFEGERITRFMAYFDPLDLEVVSDQARPGSITPSIDAAPELH